MRKRKQAFSASSGKGRLLWTVFWITFRVGLFTFGGGAAMLLMLQREFTDRQKWMDEETMTDVLAVARSLPGVISVNTAILAGYRVAGVWGGVTGGIGCVLPSILVLIVVTACYNYLVDNLYFAAALRGIRGVVAALLCATVLRLRRQSVRDLAGALIFCATLFFAVFFRQINVAFLILAGMLAGLLIYYRPKKS